MRQKFLIFAALIFLAVTLVGLNAASYSQKEKTPDSETNPNRSTYNTGATGTRALYDLLAETGRTVVRWQESPSALSADDPKKPNTFIVIGKTRREFDEREIEQLLRWVSGGGKLVIIDREPPSELIKTTTNWKILFNAESEPPFFNFDPSDQKQMTEKTNAAKPAQPTIYTNKVNAVQLSRFASAITFERFTDSIKKAGETKTLLAPPPPKVKNNFYQQIPPPPPRKSTPADSGNGAGFGIGSDNSNSIQPIEAEEADETIESPALAAPVAHLANDRKTVLADFPFGSGQIVFLSDPYIVSNGGINLVDNAQAAINIIASNGGIIAFDEFHQGYGAGENRLLGYFAGTPLTAFLFQFAALVGLILLSQSRRFARPLPEREPNRLSKLEYVAAMAELQQRTKAYDLAIENIYTDFRRRASRLVGADNFTVSRQDLARLIAERARLNAAEIENLMFKCEDIIHGEPTGKREVVELTGCLREVEEKLGLRRTRKKTFGK